MDPEERTDSEFSSGCQSGWTLYLGQSQGSFTTSPQLRTGDEDEGLSMVSDASSGPPFVHENNSFSCCCNDSFITLTTVSKCRDKRRSVEAGKKKERSFNLEDTASSPLCSCYKATNTTSLSETHFKRKIELQKQLDYLSSFCTCESSTGLQRRR